MYSHFLEHSCKIDGQKAKHEKVMVFASGCGDVRQGSPL